MKKIVKKNKTNQIQGKIEPKDTNSLSSASPIVSSDLYPNKTVNLGDTSPRDSKTD